MAVTCEFWMVRANLTLVGGMFYVFILLVIFVQKSKRFKSAYYNYLLSLGIGDTVTNIYMFIHGHNFCNNPGSDTFRCYMNVLPQTGDVVALFSMVCIATTRYVAVAKPTKMAEIISVRRQVISIVATWICGISAGIYYITLSCVLQVDPAITTVAFDDVAAIVGMVISIITLGICVATGKLLWAMAKTNIGDGKMRKRSLYLIITVLIMLLLFVFTRITTAVRQGITDPIGTNSIMYAVFAGYGNRISRVIFTTVNPILYLVFDTEVRAAIIEVLYRVRGRNKVMPVTVSTVVSSLHK